MGSEMCIRDSVKEDAKGCFKPSSSFPRRVGPFKDPNFARRQRAAALRAVSATPCVEEDVSCTDAEAERVKRRGHGRLTYSRRLYHERATLGMSSARTDAEAKPDHGLTYTSHNASQYVPQRLNYRSHNASFPRRLPRRHKNRPRRVMATRCTSTAESAPSSVRPSQRTASVSAVAPAD